MYQFGFSDAELLPLLVTKRWPPEQNKRIRLGARLMYEIGGEEGERDDYITRNISYVVPKGNGHEETVMFATTIGWWIYALARWHNGAWSYKVSALQPFGGSWEAAYHDYPWMTWEEIREEWDVYDEREETWGDDWPRVAGGFPLAINRRTDE